jgi:formylmethanofuran dehydrogenase subunit C
MGLGDEFDRDGVGEIEETGDCFEAATPERSLAEEREVLASSYEVWKDDVETITTSHVSLEDPDKGYRLARDMTEAVSSVGVREFCRDVDLERYGGVFLSGVMSVSPDDSFSLPSLPHVARVGYRNDGYGVRVRGSLGDNVGERMRAGVIRVEDDVGAMSGVLMEGGTLHIGGGDDAWLGRMMTDGEIVIEGEAQPMVGNEMEGGYIHAKNGAHNRAGSGMQGGHLEIEGDARWGIAHEMEGGCLELYGEVVEEKRDVYEATEDWGVGRDMSGGELYLQQPEPLDPTCMGGDIYVANDEGGYDLHPEVQG